MTTTDTALLRVTIDNATPRPQGSMLAMTHHGTGRPIVVHPKGVLDYRSHVAACLARGWTGAPHDQPVLVHVTFAFPRPAGHYLPANTRRPTPELRDAAPPFPVGRFIPDLDKLERLVGDALQLGGVLADDNLICGWISWKTWTGLRAGWTTVAVHPAQTP